LLAAIIGLAEDDNDDQGDVGSRPAMGALRWIKAADR
jgi:hypothetical protein